MRSRAGCSGSTSASFPKAYKAARAAQDRHKTDLRTACYIVALERLHFDLDQLVTAS